MTAPVVRLLCDDCGDGPDRGPLVPCGRCRKALCVGCNVGGYHRMALCVSCAQELHDDDTRGAVDDQTFPPG